MTIAAGTRMGRYEIRSKIGEGGMGEAQFAHGRWIEHPLRRLLSIQIA